MANNNHSSRAMVKMHLTNQSSSSCYAAASLVCPTLSHSRSKYSGIDTNVRERSMREEISNGRDKMGKVIQCMQVSVRKK